MALTKDTPPHASRLTPHVTKARIKWLCRRGMKELDVLLEQFFAAEFDRLSATDRAAFHTLVQAEDPEIYAYLLDRDRPEEPAVAAMVARIREYRQRPGPA